MSKQTPGGLTRLEKRLLKALIREVNMRTGRTKQCLCCGGGIDGITYSAYCCKETRAAIAKAKGEA